MSDILITILKKSKLFVGFNSEQLEQVILHMQPKSITLEDRDVLYERGKPADCCWLIQSGKLTVMNLSLRASFRPMIYQIGAVTGIQGLADTGSPRVVTMIADGRAELIEITHQGITHLDKDSQIRLWENVSKLLLRKLSACLSRESS